MAVVFLAAGVLFAAAGARKAEKPAAITGTVPCPALQEILYSLNLVLPRLRSELRRHLRGRGCPGRPAVLARGDKIPWQDCSWASALCRLRLPDGTALMHVDAGVGMQLTEASAISPLGLSSEGLWIGSEQLLSGAWATLEDTTVLSHSSEIAVVLPIERQVCREPLGLVPPYQTAFHWALFRVADGIRSEQLDILDSMLPLNYAAINLYLALKHVRPASHDGEKEELQARNPEVKLSSHESALDEIGWPRARTGGDAWERDEWMLDLRKMSWDFMDAAGMRADLREKEPGISFKVVRNEAMATVVDTMGEHLMKLHGFLQDLHTEEFVLPPPQRLPDVPLPQGHADAQCKAEQHFHAAGSIEVEVLQSESPLALPALGLHLAGLRPWRCHQAARWALELGVRHLHVQGEACLRAAMLALRRCRDRKRSSRLFLSASLPRAMRGADVDLLLLPPGGGSASTARVALEGRDFCDWTPYLGGSCVGDGRAVHTNMPAFLPKGVVLRLRLRDASPEFPGLRPLDDPHIQQLSEELQRSAAALIAEMHLQEGRGVLLEAPQRRVDLWTDLRHVGTFSLSRGQAQRLWELPGLAAGKIGERPSQTMKLRAGAAGKLPGTSSRDDAYGLGDMPTPSLQLVVEDRLMQSLEARLPWLLAATCLEPASCSDGASDPLTYVACLLKTFQPSPGGAEVPQHTASADVHHQADMHAPLGTWANKLAEEMRNSLPAMQQELSYNRVAYQSDSSSPRVAVLDGLLPPGLVAGLQEELPQRHLCALLEECSSGRASCDLQPGAHDFWRLSRPITSRFASEVNRFMLSELFLDILEEATERKLRPDEGFVRGNVLETLPSGYLGLHEDRSQKVKRVAPTPFEQTRLPRVNVILFLHDLEDADGTGHLEFWSSNQRWPNPLPRAPSLRVAPQSNRLVIFDTIDGIHGLPWPLQGNESRRVLQWYFVDAESGPHGPSLVEHNMPSSCSPDTCYHHVEVV